MQSLSRTIVLLIGLGCAGLGGCANLGLTGGGDTFGSATSAFHDPIGQAGSLLGGIGDSTASASKPNNTLEGQLALARLCERRNENKQAEHIYRVLIETVPNDARLYHRLGVLAVQKSDFTQAEEHFRTARSLAPLSAELLSDIGYCHYLQQRFPEAEATFNEALKIEPAHEATLNNLALVLGRQSRTREALDLFRRTNSEAEAYANLAYVFAQNGQFAQARQMYLHALTLDNTMRAAAQAVLQIDQREQARSRLKSEDLGPLAVATPAGAPNVVAGQLVRLPKTEL